MSRDLNLAEEENFKNLFQLFKSDKLQSAKTNNLVSGSPVEPQSYKPQTYELFSYLNTIIHKYSFPMQFVTVRFYCKCFEVKMPILHIVILSMTAIELDQSPYEIITGNWVLALGWGREGIKRGRGNYYCFLFLLLFLFMIILFSKVTGLQESYESSS